MLHRGDLVRPDHRLAVAKPTLFKPYHPPTPVTVDGVPIGPRTVAARGKSLVTGDTTVGLGELHDPKAPIARQLRPIRPAPADTPMRLT